MSVFDHKMLKISLKIIHFRENLGKKWVYEYILILETPEQSKNGPKITPLLGEKCRILAHFTSALFTPALIMPLTKK